ncbi:MAG TPA: type IV toxin-antitoxin system AbiEi family antitoxin [Mycobacteriales bacterium]|nr:type IV toxin-antitoxin system AbiEi family antitoxin [Mycobacteriales bacterium]
MPRRATLPAALGDRPFTTQTARAAGLTARQLQSQATRRLLQSVYVAADVPITTELRAQAVALILPPGAVVARETAAWLLGPDIRPPGDLGVDIVVPQGDEVRRPGIRCREASLRPCDVTTVCGVPVTSPTRTAFDLARHAGLIEGVVGVDAMVNRGGCDVAELARYVAQRPGWRGIRRAREVLTHVEPLSESPQESRARMRLVLAGLPRPQAQVVVRDEFGVVVARLDLGYEQWRVGIDYDGQPHESSWRYDLERQERIRGLGWWHRRYSSLATTNSWARMIDEVTRALRAAGWRS